MRGRVPILMLGLVAAGLYLGMAYGSAPGPCKCKMSASPVAQGHNALTGIRVNVTGEDS